jgi:putative DNA primase/helicase
MSELDDRFDDIPAELRQRPQWVNWRSKHRGSKVTKVPWTPGSEQPASSTDSSTWGTFDAVRAHAGGFGPDGVGYVLTDDDPYVGLDLDGCVSVDTIHPDAERIGAN